MTDATEDQLPLTADTVTDKLRAMILGGALGIGVQLKQEVLAKRFGVSRIPVREALKRLQAEGLVEHLPHKGSVVATRSVQELMETLDIRVGLESRALVLAIPHMTPAVFAQAEAIMTRYDASELPREWTELNLEFHLCLYRPCGRERLLKMIESLVRGIDIHLRAHQSYAAGHKSSQAEHREILAACMAKDTGRARDLLEAHIERTREVLRKEQETAEQVLAPFGRMGDAW